MNVTITEQKLSEVLHKYLNTTINGFDKCDYDWATYNCGMGTCCDQYAIGFVLPLEYYNEYLFKYVDGKSYDDDGDYPERNIRDVPEACKSLPNINDRRFNTIIIGEKLYSTIRKFFGHIETWRNSLLILLNRVYNLNADILLSTVLFDW